MRHRTTIIFFVALSGLASFLNYLTYPLLSRALPDQQFVDITVALSLLTQISGFLSSIVALSVGLSKQDEKEATNTIEKLQAVLMQLFIVVILLLLIFSPLLLPLIKLSPGFLIPICLLLLFSIPISIISGFLNGRRKLIKLAVVAIVSATLQFILTITIGFSSKNGILAISAMTLGQLIAIFSLYRIFRTEHLPHIATVFKHRLATYKTPFMSSLIRFTVLSSVAIMVVNVLQIMDLLLVQNRQIDTKLYTDLYVISRVVFFAGTIFIWPFLSTIDIYRQGRNFLEFGKLCGVLTVLSISAIIMLVLFGPHITNLLFGTVYPASAVIQLGVLSITYKFLFLVIMALVLFFIVIRSYWAITLPAALLTGTIIFVGIIDESTSTQGVLYGLNCIGVVGLLLGLTFFHLTVRKLGTLKQL